MASLNKKSKQNLSDSDSENEAAEFQSFVVLKSVEETWLEKLFSIEKFISNKAILQTVKKTKGNLVVVMDNQKHTENIMKMKMFHNTKYKA